MRAARFDHIERINLPFVRKMLLFGCMHPATGTVGKSPFRQGPAGCDNGPGEACGHRPTAGGETTRKPVEMFGVNWLPRPRKRQGTLRSPAAPKVSERFGVGGSVAAAPGGKGRGVCASSLCLHTLRPQGFIRPNIIYMYKGSKWFCRLWVRQDTKKTAGNLTIACCPRRLPSKTTNPNLNK